MSKLSERKNIAQSSVCIISLLFRYLIKKGKILLLKMMLYALSEINIAELRFHFAAAKLDAVRCGAVVVKTIWL